LLKRGAVPIDIAVEVEQAIVRLRISPPRAHRIVLDAGAVDRLAERLLSRIENAVVSDAAELDLVALRGSQRHLADAGPDIGAGAEHSAIRAVLVVLLGTDGAAQKYVDVGVDARRAERRAEAAPDVRSDLAVGQDAEFLARPQHIVHVLGAER